LRVQDLPWVEGFLCAGEAWGLGVWVECLGLRVGKGLGFGVWGLGFRVGVWGLGFGVDDLGLDDSRIGWR
jgi:hypothetical protein